MPIPEETLRILSLFQRAVKNGDFTEIKKIPLDGLKLAKHRLISDKGSPYYSLLEDIINEKEPEKSIHGIVVEGVSSNFAKNKIIFLAYRFVEEELIGKLKKIIKTNNYDWKEGKREDLGSISEDILSKIKNCGFFIALMTKMDQLKNGRFTTSSWLIEEKGAALAFGQRPLIIVEEGVERHYVGFLQSDDEMIFFNRNNFEGKIEQAIQKIENTYKKYMTQSISQLDLDKRTDDMIRKQEKRGEQTITKKLKQSIEELVPLFSTKLPRLSYCFYNVFRIAVRGIKANINLTNIAVLGDKLIFFQKGLTDSSEPREVIRQLSFIINELYEPMKELYNCIEEGVWVNEELKKIYYELKDEYVEIADKLNKIQKELEIDIYDFKIFFRRDLR